jgi:hypothetical protein
MQNLTGYINLHHVLLVWSDITWRVYERVVTSSGRRGFRRSRIGWLGGFRSLVLHLSACSLLRVILSVADVERNCLQLLWLNVSATLVFRLIVGSHASAENLVTATQASPKKNQRLPVFGPTVPYHIAPFFICFISHGLDIIESRQDWSRPWSKSMAWPWRTQSRLVLERSREMREKV